MDFSKFKVKVKKAATQRKTKLLRGDYAVRDKAKKVIGYATTVGQNVTSDVTPSNRTVSQLFPFNQPPQQHQQRNPKRRHYEEKRRKHHRSKRRQQREPYNPYPLI